MKQAERIPQPNYIQKLHHLWRIGALDRIDVHDKTIVAWPGPEAQVPSVSSSRGDR